MNENWGNARFEVARTVSMKIKVFQLLNSYWLSGGAECLHHQGQAVQEDCYIPERIELWTQKQFIVRSTLPYIYISVPYTFLSLHKTLWFLVNDQRDAQIPFYVFIFIYNSLHVSSTSCSSSGETNCVNTTSGNCHSVSVAVSCAGWQFTLKLHTTRPPTQSDSYQRLYW